MQIVTGTAGTGTSLVGRRAWRRLWGDLGLCKNLSDVRPFRVFSKPSLGLWLALERLDEEET